MSTLNRYLVDILEAINRIGQLNPTGDRHGEIDPWATKLCQSFVEKYDPYNPGPTNMAEVTRLRDLDSPGPYLELDPLTADNPRTFLHILRDRLVFTAGCSDDMITLIGVIIKDAPDPIPDVTFVTGGKT